MITTRRPPDKAWIFALLLYLWIIYLPLIISRFDTPESFLQGDSFYYKAAIDSLLDDGDLLLANNLPGDPLNGYLAIGINGLVPKHPILMSLVSLPFYSFFGTPGLLLFNLIDCMILLVFVFKFNTLFFDHVVSFITTILYATGTLFFDYAFNYSPDIFSSVLLIAGLYFVLQKRIYLGAFLLGLSIFAKLPNALLAGVILCYAVFVVWKDQAISNSDRNRRTLTTTFLIGTVFLAALAPFGSTNAMLFGSPFVTGYQRMAVAGPEGQMLSVDHSEKFNQPLLKGMGLLMFDPRHGILMTNPVLFLALLGVIRLRRIQVKDGVYLVLTLCLMQFLLFAKYDEWATSHFSNRFLMTFIALSSVFTSNFLDHLGIRSWFHTSD